MAQESVLPPSTSYQPEDPRRFGSTMWRRFARDLAVFGLLPWLLVFILRSNHVSVRTALLTAALVSLGFNLFALARRRSIDIIGIINLTFLLASIALTHLTGDVHVMLLKGAVMTGCFSALCLGSLLTPRPLMFYIGRQYWTSGDPARLAQWNARSGHPRFRQVTRFMTLVWGLGYLAEVVARVIMAYTLAPYTVALLAPIVTYGVLAALMFWTIGFVRKANQAAREQQRGAPS
ncbi:MAG TPA: VC0807 family protein [Candidatus Baltobacteraceae bacterium]